jgi:hypothetical protein
MALTVALRTIGGTTHGGPVETTIPTGDPAASFVPAANASAATSPRGTLRLVAKRIWPTAQ